MDTENRETEITTPGVPGELCVKGPQIMKGYINLPDVTQKTVRDGWLYTGDLVKADEEGYYYIVDRAKDMVTCGGENIFPVEIEDFLMEHGKIQDAAVIGVPARENAARAPMSSFAFGRKRIIEPLLRRGRRRFPRQPCGEP